MVDTAEIPSIISDISDKTGHKYDEREARFAISLAKGESKADAYRHATGYDGDYAGQQGHKMAKSPHIQEAVEAIKEYSTDLISDDFIRQAFLKEALEAEYSRDRRGALESLAKIRGMYKDVVEQTNYSKLSDSEYLGKVEEQFGKEARDKAAEEMGID